MAYAAATQTDTLAAADAEKPPVLELRNVAISYFVRAGEMKVVPNISFKLGQGEALGLVGESGCGKSTVAFAVMQYLGGVGRITNGQILFEGRDLAKMLAGGAARDPRPHDLHGLSGPDEQPQPGHPDRQAAHGSADHPFRRRAKRKRAPARCRCCARSTCPTPRP